MGCERKESRFWAWRLGGCWRVGADAVVCCPDPYPLTQRPSLFQLLGVLVVDNSQLSSSPKIPHCWRASSHARVLFFSFSESYLVTDWYISHNLYLLRAHPNKFDACQSLSQSLFPEDPNFSMSINLYLSRESWSKTKANKQNIIFLPSREKF